MTTSFTWKDGCDGPTGHNNAAVVSSLDNLGIGSVVTARTLGIHPDNWKFVGVPTRDTDCGYGFQAGYDEHLVRVS